MPCCRAAFFGQHRLQAKAGDRRISGRLRFVRQLTETDHPVWVMLPAIGMGMPSKRILSRVQWQQAYNCRRAEELAIG